MTRSNSHHRLRTAGLGLGLALAALCGCASGEDESEATTSTSSFTAAIHYRYDALGRVIQAAASDGTGVQYSYDSVGNITAQRRLVSTTLRVLDASPPSGAVGSTVVVFGSGFNPTPTLNTVSFNGTAATVTEANANALTVTVPTGATTGKIAVANALGSAVSPANFVVMGPSPAPTITSFTPTVGAVNTVVSVSGAHFQTNAEDDKVSVAGRLAETVQDGVSPTATLVKLRVPTTTASGKIAITTSFGTAVSIADFFAVPTTVDPASVEVTGRVAVAGAPLTATTTIAGKKIVLVFDGQAGQRLHVRTASGTFATGFAADLYDPAGAKLQTLPLVNNGVVDVASPLGLTGVYTLVINPTVSDKGSVQISVVLDALGTLTVDGSTAIALTPGQNARYSFTAQAGKGYGLAINPLMFTPGTGTPAPSLLVTLRKSDGTSLTTCSFSAAESCDLEPTSFATAGTYLIDFDPNSTYAASFTAILSADTGGAVSVDAGSPTAVGIARAGQNARYTFNGTAGNLVNVVLSSSTLDDGNSGTTSTTQVQIFKPGDAVSPIGNTTFNQFAASAVLDLTLPLTGTYTIVIKPNQLNLGSVNLNVKSVATGAMVVDGSTAMNLSAGRNGRFSFTAQAGKGYGLAITPLTFTPGTGAPPPTLLVTLRKADGTSLATCTFSAVGSCDLEPASFVTAGTYFLDFDANNLYAASFTAILSTDTGGTVTIDAASPTVVTTARAGQNARYTFSGTAGNLVNVVLSGSTLDDGNSGTTSTTQVQIFKPGDAVSPIGNTTFNQFAASAVLDLTLPLTGTYTIVIKPNELNLGSVNLNVKSVATGTLAVDASTVENLSAGRNGRFSFTAQAGKGYGLAVTALAFTPSTATPTPAMLVTLRKADGTSLATCSFSANDSCDLSALSFATAGTYLLDFDPNGLVAASFNVVLSVDVSGSVTVDAPTPTTVTFVRAGQNARYSVAGTAGQLVKVVITGNAIDDGNATTSNATAVTVFKPSSPNASPIGSTSFVNAAAGATLNLTLPEAGTYGISISPSGLDSGSINLGVTHQ